MNPIGLTAAQTPDTCRLDRKGNRAGLKKLRHSESELESEQMLHHRQCKRSISCSDLSRLSGEGTDNTAFSRDSIGSKGLYFMQMKDACLPVPRFECIDTRILKAIEKHPVDLKLLKNYLPEDMPNIEEIFYHSKHSLVEIKARISQIFPSDKDKQGQWLDGLSALIASDAFYKQVKDSYAAREIRTFHQKLNSPFKPVIVRGSSVTEDRFSNAQTGKYQSMVHGEADIVRTCLKVMASNHCSRGCLQGMPQPMAIILQNYISCSFGGVAVSSLQDKTIRVEYVPGQPKGAVTGQSGIIPHGYIIKRDEGQITSTAFTRGNIPATFVLEKIDGDSGFMEVKKKAEDSSVSGYDELRDDTLEILHYYVERLENLLLSPVEIEFGIDLQGRLFLFQVVIPPPGILDLPPEIITKVISMLPMKDIKNFKVTCTYINDIIESNYLVEKCWFNKFPSIIQYKFSEVFSRENYEGNLRSWIQQFDNNFLAQKLDKLKRIRKKFHIIMSFHIARTFKKAPRLEVVEKATFHYCSQVSKITLSPDSRHLMIISEHFEKVEMTSLNSQGGWTERMLIDNRNLIKLATFSPDSRHFVIVFCDGKAKLYSLNSQRGWKENSFVEHVSEDCFSARFSPDSLHLITVSRFSRPGKLYRLNNQGVWDESTLFIVEHVSMLTFSPDSHHLLIVYKGCKVRLYGLNSQNVWAANGNMELDQWVNLAYFSPDGRHLMIVTKYYVGKVILVSLNRQGVWSENTNLNNVYGGCIEPPTFSPDSLHVGVAYPGGKAMLYSLNSQGLWAENGTIKRDKGIRVVSFTPDNRQVVIASGDGKVSLYSLNSQGEWIEKGLINEHPTDISSATFSPDSSHLAIASDDGKVILHSLNTQSVRTPNCTIEHDSRVRSVTFSPDSRHVVSLSTDDEAKMLSLNSLGMWAVKSINVHVRRFLSATFSLDGLHLWVTFEGGDKIFSLNSRGTWVEIFSIGSGNWNLRFMPDRFSPVGRFLCSIDDQAIRVFEIIPLVSQSPA